MNISTILQYIVITYSSIQGLRYAWKHREWIKPYRQINLRFYLTIIPLFVLTIIVTLALYALNTSIFGWSLITWIGSLLEMGNTSGIAGNISLTGTTLPVIGIGLCILLLIQLPNFARTEERLFRTGTKNWLDGTVRSILFGLVHILAGIPLAPALAIILSGLWFTQQYFKGGEARSTQYHFQYNLLVLIVIVIVAIAATITFFA